MAYIFDILSAILSGIYSDILFGILSGIPASVLTFFLAFFLAGILTFFLSCVQVGARAGARRFGLPWSHDLERDYST